MRYVQSLPLIFVDEERVLELEALSENKTANDVAVALGLCVESTQNTDISGRIERFLHDDVVQGLYMFNKSDVVFAITYDMAGDGRWMTELFLEKNGTYTYICAVDMMTPRGDRDTDLAYNGLFMLDKTQMKDIEKALNDTRAHIISVYDTALLRLCVLYLWLKQSSSYAVESKPVVKQGSKNPSRSTVKKRPWVANQEKLVTIEFLNEIPREPREVRPHQGGTHRSPVAHTRRGHYRTLRSEKYKGHPLYGVQDGVYVKPTWVGPTEGVFRQREYRLLSVKKGQSDNTPA